MVGPDIGNMIHDQMFVFYAEIEQELRKAIKRECGGTMPKPSRLKKLFKRIGYDCVTIGDCGNTTSLYRWAGKIILVAEIESMCSWKIWHWEDDK